MSSPNWRSAYFPVQLFPLTEPLCDAYPCSIGLHIDHFPPFCAAKITVLNFPTCVLPSPSSIICLPVLMFSAAALHCHLPFILFAEASVKQFGIGYWKYSVQQIPILLWQGHGGVLVPVTDGFNSCIKVLTASSCSEFHLYSFPIREREYNVQVVVENPDTCFLQYPWVLISLCNSFQDWDDCSCSVFLKVSGKIITLPAIHQVPKIFASSLGPWHIFQVGSQLLYEVLALLLLLPHLFRWISCN